MENEFSVEDRSELQFAISYFSEQNRGFESAISAFRVRERLARISGNPWLQVQEQVGPAEGWPEIIRRKVWCSNLRYSDRAFLAAFGFGNGIPRNLWVAVIKFCNPAATKQKLFKIRALYEYFNQTTPEGDLIRDRYFHYNLIVGRVLTLNRNIRVRADVPPPLIPITRVRRDAVNYHC